MISSGASMTGREKISGGVIHRAVGSIGAGAVEDRSGGAQPLDIEALAAAGTELLKTVGAVVTGETKRSEPKVKLMELLSGVADPAPLPPIHKQMIEQYGADIGDQMPILARRIEEKMDAIGRKLCELYELPAMLLPRLVVLDAPEWMFRMVEPNKRDSESERGLHHNTIYTSIGALERLLSTPGLESEEQVAMLFAVLGHEVAHSIEMIDPDSKTTSHLNEQDKKLQGLMIRVASHYREYKADVEAAVGLHATGTDPKWLIRALGEIDVAWKDVTYLASTHPEPDTRSYVLSVASALLRQQYGNGHLERAEPMDPAERTKVRSLFERALARRTEEKLRALPATVPETLDAIDAALAVFGDATHRWGVQNGASKPDAQRNLHRACKHLHRQLAQGATDDEVRAAFTRMAGLDQIGNGRSIPLLSEADLKTLFAAVPSDALTSAGALLSPKDVEEGTLASFWHGLPAAYREQCVRVVTAALQEVRDEVFGRFACAAVCVPLEVLLPAQPGLAEFWASNRHTIPRELAIPAETDQTGQSWAATAAFVLTNVLPKLDLAEKAERFIGQSGQWHAGVPTTSIPLVTESSPEKQVADARAELRRQIAKSDAPAFAAYRKGLEVIWQDRAFFAVADLIGRSPPIDWPLIFDAVGLSPEQGHAELNGALIAACESGAVTELIDHVSKSIVAGKYYPLTHLVPDGDRLATRPIWIDGEAQAALDALAPRWTGQKLSPGRDGALLLRAIPRYSRPAELTAVYRADMKAGIEEKPPQSLAQLAEQHRLVSGSWEGFRTYDFHLRSMKEPRQGRRPMHGEMSVLLELLDRSTLPKRTEILRELVSVAGDKAFKSFERDQGMFPARSWIIPDEPAATLANLEILQRHGVVPEDAGALCDWHTSRATYQRDKKPLERDSYPVLAEHFDFLNLVSEKVAPEVRADLELARDPGDIRARIQKWSEILFRSDVALGDAPKTRMALVAKRGDGLEALRTPLIEAAKRAELSVAETLALHRSLCIVAPTRELDELLRDAFVRAVATGEEVEQAVDYVLESADQGRLATRTVIADVTRHLLEGELTTAESQPVRPRHLFRITAAVHQLMGGASGPKDQVLEEIADRLRLDAKTCERFIEVGKSTNFRLLPSYIAQAVSLSSYLVTQLARSDLEGVVDFVLGTKTRLPDGLTLAAAKGVIASDGAGDMLDGVMAQGTGMARAVQTGKAMAEGARVWLENRVHETSLEQRGVLVGLLMTLGASPLSGTEADLESVLARFGGFQEGSVALKHASCLLETLPEEERGVALGLVLAHARERGGEMNLAAAAEVFRTVGLKLAQLVSVWKVFGDVSSSAEDAKDNAKGLSRGPTLRIISNELDTREQGEIAEVGDQVAAASIKSCRRMTKKDGTVRAMMIRDPSADGQVEENLRMLNDYFERARKKGLVPNDVFFADILRDFSSMLFDEIDFRREADKIRRASGLCDVLNQELAPTLDGWSFVVPKVDEDFHVSPNVMVLEFAKGARVRALREDPDVPREVLEHVGRCTLAFKLKLALDHGEVSPDPHTGNVWVDLENKQIYLLDWGQLLKLDTTGPFESDDRYVFVRFLAALKSRDPSRIVEASLGMLREGNLDRAGRARVTAAITAACKSSESIAELLPDVVRSLSEAGAPVRSAFTVGLLKQLMILEGENYVPRDECLEIISKAAQSFVINKKAPRFLLDQLGYSSRR